MWKKLIACCVILAFLLTIVPQASADQASADAKKDAQDVILYVGAVIVGIMIVGAILSIVSRKASQDSQASREQPIPPIQQSITSEKDTYILAYSEHDNILDTFSPDYESFTNPKNFPIEFSEAGVVVLKW